jgi:hypothetical protein
MSSHKRFKWITDLWAAIGHVLNAATVYQILASWAVAASVTSFVAWLESMPVSAVIAFALLSAGGLAMLLVAVRSIASKESPAITAQQPLPSTTTDAILIMQELHELGSSIERTKEDKWKQHPRLKPVYDLSTNWHSEIRRIEQRLRAFIDRTTT